MKNIEVVKAFSRGERAISSSGNIHSTGDCLYSYNTCIAEYDKHNTLWVNLTKYSVTTSCHQTLVKRVFTDYIVVNNIERNKVHIVPRDERIYM